MKISALIASLLLAGCVSSSETYTQSGKKGHTISCTPGWTGGIVGAVANASTSWAQCYQRAGELCGAGGYKILEQVGEAGVYSQGGAYVNQNGGAAGGFTSTTNNRMMIVQCNDPAIEAALAKKRSM
jgi:hypothetical protein